MVRPAIPANEILQRRPALSDIPFVYRRLSLKGVAGQQVAPFSPLFAFTGFRLIVVPCTPEELPGPRAGGLVGVGSEPGCEVVEKPSNSVVVKVGEVQASGVVVEVGKKARHQALPFAFSRALSSVVIRLKWPTR